MKTTIIIFGLLTLNLSAFAKKENPMVCLSEAMQRSQSFKLQNLALNVSLDDHVTFSCKNLTRTDVKELQGIRKDQEKLIAATLARLNRGEVIQSLEIARLGAELGNRPVTRGDMCPLIESNYQSQISRGLSQTFAKELDRCPSAQEEIRAKYEAIISDASHSRLPVQDACQSMVKKLQALKDSYSSHCGVANVRPRHRLGVFALRAPAQGKSLRVRN